VLSEFSSRKYFYAALETTYGWWLFLFLVNVPVPMTNLSRCLLQVQQTILLTHFLAHSVAVSPSTRSCVSWL
jgi:hypothetical protein